MGKSRKCCFPHALSHGWHTLSFTRLAHTLFHTAGAHALSHDHIIMLSYYHVVSSAYDQWPSLVSSTCTSSCRDWILIRIHAIMLSCYHVSVPISSCELDMHIIMLSLPSPVGSATWHARTLTNNNAGTHALSHGAFINARQHCWHARPFTRQHHHALMSWVRQTHHHVIILSCT